MYKYRTVLITINVLPERLTGMFQTALDKQSADGWRLASVVPDRDWAILIFEKESRSYQDFAMTTEQYRKMYLNEWNHTEE